MRSGSECWVLEYEVFFFVKPPIANLELGYVGNLNLGSMLVVL